METSHIIVLSLCFLLICLWRLWSTFMLHRVVDHKREEIEWYQSGRFGDTIEFQVL
jgi:hypothetical protein